MKNFILVFLMLLLLNACVTIRQVELKIGTYEAPAFFCGDENISLRIGENNKFQLYWCGNIYTGSYEQFNDNTIILKFDEQTDPLIYLQLGAIISEEKIIQIKNNNKLITDGITLKRVR